MMRLMVALLLMGACGGEIPPLFLSQPADSGVMTSSSSPAAPVADGGASIPQDGGSQTVTCNLDDNNNCGQCGNVCLGGQTCVNRACLCPTSQTFCNNLCVNAQSDNANCGTCNNLCSAPGTVCRNGACRCPDGQTYCNGCVSTLSDNNHCGVCGNVCTGGKSCQNSSCQCPSGLVLCGNTCQASCVDAGTTLDGGACGSGLSLCGTSCASLQNDNANCGGCNNSCSGGRSCQNALCQCPSGQAFCSNACVSTQSDNSNCGSCGNACTGGRSCQGSQCLCPLGQVLCGSTCQTSCVDAGVDGGSSPDGGLADGGIIDAGVRDAGIADAGTPVDAGVPDGGFNFITNSGFETDLSGWTFESTGTNMIATRNTTGAVCSGAGELQLANSQAGSFWWHSQAKWVFGSDSQHPPLEAGVRYRCTFIAQTEFTSGTLLYLLGVQLVRDDATSIYCTTATMQSDAGQPVTVDPSENGYWEKFLDETCREHTISFTTGPYAAGAKCRLMVGVGRFGPGSRVWLDNVNCRKE